MLNPSTSSWQDSRQPFSIAGKHLGETDERHLWPSGILPAIQILRPQTVWLENVPGLLSDGGQVFAKILTDLCANGYSIRWKVVGACRIGACHHRHRLFISAVQGDGFPLDDGALFGVPIDAVKKWCPAGYCQDREVWTEQTSVCGFHQGLPTPTARDAIRGAGWGDRTGRPLSEVIAALLSTPTASDHTGAGHTENGGENLRTSVTNWGRFIEAIAAHSIIAERAAPIPTTPGPRGAERLNPAFVEWMMLLPNEWVTGVAIGRNAQIKALGNGVVPLQAATAFRDMYKF
jgi:DNA (cytosine-5)-methyltransferase 1